MPSAENTLSKVSQTEMQFRNNKRMIFFFFFFFSFFFWWYWSFNSRSQPCYAGDLPLAPCPLPFCSGHFFNRVLHFCPSQLDSDSPIYISSEVGMTNTHA
jgi:hypothetical protein